MNKAELMVDIIARIRRLFHHLGHLSEVINKNEVSAPERAVLEELLAEDRQTIPDIARKKGVTRQHILNQAGLLKENGYIDYVDNPAHRRSFLLVLTDKGRACIEKCLARELKVIEGFVGDLKKGNLEETLSLLDSFLEKMERYNHK